MSPRRAKAPLSSQGGTVKRIELPERGWWDLEVEPLWDETMRVRRLLLKVKTEDQQINTVLAALTRAWSFPEPVSVAALNKRRLRDMVPVMKEVNQTLLPLFAALAPSD